MALREGDLAIPRLLKFVVALPCQEDDITRCCCSDQVLNGFTAIKDNGGFFGGRKSGQDLGGDVGRVLSPRVILGNYRIIGVAGGRTRHILAATLGALSDGTEQAIELPLGEGAEATQGGGKRGTVVCVIDHKGGGAFGGNDLASPGGGKSVDMRYKLRDPATGDRLRRKKGGQQIIDLMLAGKGKTSVKFALRRDERERGIEGVLPPAWR